MEGFFELRTPADLRAKLRRDFARIEADTMDADAYFDFFVTAESIVDWLHPGRVNKAAREALRDASPYLQVCSHLASGAKHLKGEAKHHDSVAATDLDSAEPPGFAPGGFSPPGFFPQFLVVGLDGAAALELGPSITAFSLARQVLAFWDTYPLS